MSERIDHGFDEALISGYLDGELTQADAQRVRLHLEDCAECGRLADELTRIREAAMSTDFHVPDDRQWDETPRGGFSRVLRNGGWLMLVAWIVGLSVYGIYHLVIDTENLLENLLAFSMFLGFGLVFFSVLLDRLKSWKTDRYRGVEK